MPASSTDAVERAPAASWSVLQRWDPTLPVWIAAALLLDRERVCHSARIVLTGVGSAPKVVPDLAQLLEGKKISRENIEAVAEAAAKVSHPVDNADLDYWYRKRMTKVYVKRALASLAGLELEPEVSTKATSE